MIDIRSSFLNLLGKFIFGADLLRFVDDESVCNVDDAYWLRNFLARFGVDNSFVLYDESSLENFLMYGYKFYFNNTLCLRISVNKTLHDSIFSDVVGSISELKRFFSPDVMEVIISEEKICDNSFLSDLSRVGLNFSVRKRVYKKNLSEDLMIDLPNFLKKNYVNNLSDESVTKVLSDVMRNKIERDSFLMPKEYYSYLFNGVGKDEAKSQWLLWSVDEDFVGISLFQYHVPRKNSKPKGSLCYFGVIENAQKKGLGVLLHKLAMSELRKNGIEEYFGSTDVNNYPMIKVFLKNGCISGDEYLVFRCFS